MKHKVYLTNGARCRDDVKVLWCHSYLVLLAFEAPSLQALVFFKKKVFDDMFVYLQPVFVLEGIPG